MIYWVVRAVSVQVECLGRGERDGTHPDRVDLREAALFAVVRAVDGVVEAGRRTSVVTREASIIRCQRAFGVQGGAEGEVNLLIGPAIRLISYKPCPKMIRVIGLNILNALASKVCL